MKRRILVGGALCLALMLGLKVADQIIKQQSQDALRIVLDEHMVYEIALEDRTFDFEAYIREAVGETSITITQGDIAQVGPMQVEYRVFDRYGQQKMVNATFEVVDRIAPSVTLKKEQLALAYDVDVLAAMKENIASYADNYDPAPQIELQYDPLSKQGVYRVKDVYGNEQVKTIPITVQSKPVVVVPPASTAQVQPTYINSVLLVNKTHAIPKEFVSPQKGEAYARLQEMLQAAALAGHKIPLLSGYRSYSQQAALFQKYVNAHGLESAQMFSARPGHSEHQSGLGYDIGSISNAFANTTAYAWLQEHAAQYGFIERYPNGKTHITGYVFEPWHYRYVGITHATAIKVGNLTLEEYLGAK